MDEEQTAKSMVEALAEAMGVLELYKEFEAVSDMVVPIYRAFTALDVHGAIIQAGATAVATCRVYANAHDAIDRAALDDGWPEVERRFRDARSELGVMDACYEVAKAIDNAKAGKEGE